ncbi:MAG: hypothetical protein ACPKPY_10845 [Nitrososphaeraceae archaeon]
MLVTLFTNNKLHKLKNSYSVSDTLLSYLDERVTTTKQRMKILDAGEKISDELEKKNNSLKKRKVWILDKYIFPSMANLVVFFECLEKNPEIRELFEDDIKELLGYVKEPLDKTKEDQSSYFARHNIITRFLESLLYNNFFKNDPNNFRLELLSDIQRIIFNQITSLARYESDMSGVDSIIQNHMGQAWIWTKSYAYRYNKSEQGKVDSQSEPHRPINF